MPAINGYNASSNPTITAYTLLVSGANLELVQSSNPSNILAEQAAEYHGDDYRVQQQ